MLNPKKGTASAAPKIKPSRRDALLAAASALAAEQLPTDDTMHAIEGEPVAEAAPIAAPIPVTVQVIDVAPVARPTGDVTRGADGQRPSSHEDGSLHVEQLRIADVRPSPFQPRGRPSAAAVSAVRLAIAESGSLEVLASKDGTRIFGRLDPEAARLAELAYDIQQHGVKTPIEVRIAEDGAIECLSGHRRLAAATLAGLAAIPALDNGPMSSAAAAATVLRGNLHRENFTTWQEAVLVSEVQERRRADGFQDNVRTLGQVMGWSHGKTNMLLRIRRALAPELLARVADGQVAPVEERLSRIGYRDLERLANEGDDAVRIAAVRRLLGLHGGAPVSPRDRAAYLHRPKRGGGFLIEVNDAVESLSAMDALALKEVLEAQLGRVDARLRQLGR